MGYAWDVRTAKVAHLSCHVVEESPQNESTLRHARATPPGATVTSCADEHFYQCGSTI
jgi:hypothetical protein